VPKPAADGGNLMGGAHTLTLVNAQLWTQRIREHTRKPFAAWLAVITPPRRLSLNDSYAGKSIFLSLLSQSTIA
jgi:hypothetical protein